MPDFVWIQEAVFPILGMAMATFFGWQILRIINGHLERKSGKATSGELKRMQDEIERLRAMVETHDEVRHQLGDLEERVEFTERILAKSRNQLEAGQG